MNLNYIVRLVSVLKFKYVKAYIESLSYTKIGKTLAISEHAMLKIHAVFQTEFFNRTLTNIA